MSTSISIPKLEIRLEEIDIFVRKFELLMSFDRCSHPLFSIRLCEISKSVISLCNIM